MASATEHASSLLLRAICARRTLAAGMVEAAAAAAAASVCHALPCAAVCCAPLPDVPVSLSRKLAGGVQLVNSTPARGTQPTAEVDCQDLARIWLMLLRISLPDVLVSLSRELAGGVQLMHSTPARGTQPGSQAARA